MMVAPRTGENLGGGAMASTLGEVIAAARAEQRAKIAAAYRQKLIEKKKKRQLEEAKRVMELDRNLIVFVVLIVALPIIAALTVMLTALALSQRF
jgi:hypothetical protein